MAIDLGGHRQLLCVMDKITKKQQQHTPEVGSIVGVSVTGTAVVGVEVGVAVVGAAVGAGVAVVGASVGAIVGTAVVGANVGVGASVGVAVVGIVVGVAVVGLAVKGIALQISLAHKQRLSCRQESLSPYTLQPAFKHLCLVSSYLHSLCELHSALSSSRS